MVLLLLLYLFIYFLIFIADGFPSDHHVHKTLALVSVYSLTSTRLRTASLFLLRLTYSLF